MMLDEWAFARVELNMTLGEYLSYTPRQFDAVLAAWEKRKQREYALTMTCSMNARWGSKTNLLPFQISDFLPAPPKTKEEQAAIDERLAKAKTAVLQKWYEDMAKDLGPIPKHLKKPKKKQRGRK